MQNQLHPTATASARQDRPWPNGTRTVFIELACLTDPVLLTPPPHGAIDFARQLAGRWPLVVLFPRQGDSVAAHLEKGAQVKEWLMRYDIPFHEVRAMNGIFVSPHAVPFRLRNDDDNPYQGAMSAVRRAARR